MLCAPDSPILRAKAERHGADIRFNTELVSFAHERDAVLARIRDRSSGAETGVRAQYLIGADGTQSGVRDAVGIGRHGPGVLQHWMNVIFEADLPTTIDGRVIRSAFVTDINGTLVPRGDGRWLMAVQFAPDRGERAEDVTSDCCRDLIRRGAGQPDLAVDIVDARPWEAAAAVADPTDKSHAAHHHARQRQPCSRRRPDPPRRQAGNSRGSRLEDVCRHEHAIDEPHERRDCGNQIENHCKGSPHTCLSVFNGETAQGVAI